MPGLIIYDRETESEYKQNLWDPPCIVDRMEKDRKVKAGRANQHLSVLLKLP